MGVRQLSQRPQPLGQTETAKTVLQYAFVTLVFGVLMQPLALHGPPAYAPQLRSYVTSPYISYFDSCRVRWA